MPCVNHYRSTGALLPHFSPLLRQGPEADPSQLAESLSVKPGVASSGVFNTPDGAIGSDPLRTMGTYSFEFSAEEGDNLSFTTMFVQSNDWFIGPVDEGLPLFRNGVPISGEITDEMYLWDAGTEADQLPGLGADQPVRQSGPNIGADHFTSKLKLGLDVTEACRQGGL